VSDEMLPDMKISPTLADLRVRVRFVHSSSIRLPPLDGASHLVPLRSRWTRFLAAASRPIMTTLAR